MDRDVEAGEKCQWMLHQNAANGPECVLATTWEISETIRARRLRLAGHFTSCNEETASKVLLWEPQQGHPNRGRPRTTYIDTIKADTGLDNTSEIRDAMLNQIVWKDFIRTARDNS